MGSVLIDGHETNLKPFDACKHLKVGDRIKKVVFKEGTNVEPLSCVNHRVAKNDRDGKLITLDWDFETTFSYTDVESMEL